MSLVCNTLVRRADWFILRNGDATEVFSRTQGPQHWHIARREPEGTVHLEVLRKETSLADVENELVGIVRRFRGS